MEGTVLDRIIPTLEDDFDSPWDQMENGFEMGFKKYIKVFTEYRRTS